MIENKFIDKTEIHQSPISRIIQLPWLWISRSCSEMKC